MGGIVGSSKPKLPDPAPPPPQREDPDVQAARERELERNRLARGRRTTLLTGGEGVTEAAPVARKTLLGQ